MARPLRRLLLPAALLELVGLLEGAEIVRQRRRGASRLLVSSASDRDPASVRLLALTWWPAGIAALVEAWLPRADAGRKWAGPGRAAGITATCAGIALRQWAIHTLGQYFVGHVLVQPGQPVISTGPYRWLRHPSYTGLWLEMIGVGLATGNVASIATCTLVPLVGITARITGEERELTAGLPGYRDYMQGRPRLIPHIW